ncbi:hypothetical protein [Rhodosalinus sediminis]|jgi:hypothetical protein|uniref:hypothetical protein n=1 Tax=Rhodosalinus sediminis TaxID=1940533 RepID=UPI002353E752|nr:hypothetical protein [Rhodosalinus sediminis]
MSERPVRRVEDYTGTCLVLLALNLFWMLVALMLTLGWPAVLVTAVALDAGLRRLRRAPVRD